MRILLIEDDTQLADLVARALTDVQYQVEVAHDGVDGSYLLNTFPFDLAIIDLGLPGHGGLEVIRSARRQGITTPILILSARDAVDDRVSGLDEGADDYVVKPASFAELKARARALLRRGRGATPPLTCGGVKLDPVRRRVSLDDVEVHLTAREFALLEFFLRHQGATFTRSQIGEHVWDMNFESTSNVIDVYVNYLRRKLDRPGAPSLIATIRGVGYRCEATSA